MYISLLDYLPSFFHSSVALQRRKESLISTYIITHMNHVTNEERGQLGRCIHIRRFLTSSYLNFDNCCLAMTAKPCKLRTAIWIGIQGLSQHIRVSYCTFCNSITFFYKKRYGQMPSFSSYVVNCTSSSSRS
jgi:hypothetical protein